MSLRRTDGAGGAPLDADSLTDSAGAASPAVVLGPDDARRRDVVSYKRRRGRLSDAHRAAMLNHAGSLGLDLSAAPARLDFETLFGRRAPVILEIGFGMGETTLAMATADPARDVLAIDVHTPGIGALMRDAAAAGLTNLRVAEGDAMPLLRDRIEPGSLDEIRVFFPDPWPKKRHHKRRLVSPEFVALAARALGPGGHLHLATDWPDYAAQMVAVVSAEPLLANPFEANGGFAPRPAWRPVTRFEAQGLAKGHPVADVLVERLDDATTGVSEAEFDVGSQALVEVVAAAIVDDLRRPARLLAARRSAPLELAGMWEFPGGKRERGESAVDALRRELHEELGVEVELGEEIPCPSDDSGWPIRPGFVMRVWPARLVGGEPRPLADHDELRWLSRREWVEAVEWLPADVPIVRHLKEYLPGEAS